MNATLSAMNGFLLALSWQADPGTTCTIQTSLNLTDWTSLPYVFQMEEAAGSYTLEANPSPVFVRLRYDSDGDTNDNGLPDLWEWQTFGHIDIDPAGDPDKDGLSNYSEWLNGTDPHDFFNGEQTSIHISCGTDWLVQVNELSTQSVALVLLDSRGNPIADAPVRLRLQSGREGLLQSGDPVQAAVAEMLAFTDSAGRIRPDTHDIRYIALSGLDQEDVLIIEAGTDSTEIRIHAVPGQIGGPPRSVRREFVDSSTVIYKWRGDAGSAESFRVEELEESGEWTPLLELAAGEIPEPDALTGQYVVIHQTP